MLHITTLNSIIMLLHGNIFTFFQPILTVTTALGLLTIHVSLRFAGFLITVNVINKLVCVMCCLPSPVADLFEFAEQFTYAHSV